MGWWTEHGGHAGGVGMFALAGAAIVLCIIILANSSRNPTAKASYKASIGIALGIGMTGGTGFLIKAATKLTAGDGMNAAMVGAGAMGVLGLVFLVIAGKQLWANLNLC